MPEYDFRCRICKADRTVFKSVTESIVVECCGVEMARCYKAVSPAIPLENRAVKDKSSYYGINIHTGEGVTEHTRLDRPSGIKTTGQ